MKKNLLFMSGLVAMLLSSCDQDITNVINLPGGQDTTTPAAQKEVSFTASMDGMNTRAVSCGLPMQLSSTGLQRMHTIITIFMLILLMFQEQ